MKKPFGAYSVRSAAIGLIRVARLAGSQVATNVAAARTVGAIVNALRGQPKAGHEGGQVEAVGPAATLQDQERVVRLRRDQKRPRGDDNAIAGVVDERR